MKTKFMYGLALTLSLGLAACGDSTDEGIDGGITTRPDAAQTIDSAVPDPFVWIVVQDTEQIACATNGPGADIDAVALVSAAGAPLGWGKIGTAVFTTNALGNACENADCSGGNCKYAWNGTTYLAETLVSWTEGEKDGYVQAVGDDSGYFSLNAGTLQIQMGDLTGAGLAKELKTGDIIQVFEVDQTYITTGDAPATCICGAEHYTVALQSAAGRLLPLAPAVYSTDNTACGLVTAATEGCGTTVFVVP